ncbi:MAG: winged-helix transcriptional response regulator [uncultured bacterium]|nr:MAG: winged-helix transcriptional response regulator [uncultured bacterium]
MLKTGTTVVLNQILTSMPVLAGILGIGRYAKPTPGSASGTPGKSKEGERARCRILLITAEKGAVRALKAELESKRCEAMQAHSAEDGFFLLSTGMFDLVLVDRMLQGRGSAELLNAMKRCGIKTPVLLHSPVEQSMDAQRIVSWCQEVKAGCFGEWPSEIVFKENEIWSVKEMELPRKAHSPHSQRNPGKPMPSEGAAIGMSTSLHTPPQRQ